MAKSQTNTGKLGAAVLFVCIHATWWQNIQDMDEVIYFDFDSLMCCQVQHFLKDIKKNQKNFFL